MKAWNLVWLAWEEDGGGENGVSGWEIGFSSLASCVKEIKVFFPTCKFSCLSILLTLYARELQVPSYSWQRCLSLAPLTRVFLFLS